MSSKSRRRRRSVPQNGTNQRLHPTTIRRYEPPSNRRLYFGQPVITIAPARRTRSTSYLMSTALGDTSPKLTNQQKARALTNLMNQTKALHPRSAECLRRKIRKEVLFAKALTSKGTHGKKNHTVKSDYRC